MSANVRDCPASHPRLQNRGSQVRALPLLPAVFHHLIYINELSGATAPGSKVRQSSFSLRSKEISAIALASEPLLLGGAGVDLGLRDRRPIEHCHQLAVVAPFSAAIVAAAFFRPWAVHWGRPASSQRSRNQLPKPSVGERLAVLGLQKRQGAAGAIAR